MAKGLWLLGDWSTPSQPPPDRGRDRPCGWDSIAFRALRDSSPYQGEAGRGYPLEKLPPPARDILLHQTNIPPQMGGGIDQVDRGLAAAPGEARQGPMGQTENIYYGLCQGDHGYNHPYGDGSGLGFHGFNLASNTGDFQLKLDLGA
ncbi:hypothetical protein GCM10007913_22900 [Devosia yakushimensis]|uniref:Uncharacterized protein n=1 Tax=Devosia yakushimensis TaxID=470028 RepID=A0ABQ5UEB4_9HYPH|nr:hypothetical protein GCM10007913_22900 [Devosia yakushimensis]